MQKHSFTDILNNDILIDEKKEITIRFTKIEIPMIQRDYAQGRSNQEIIRDRFLENIFLALKNNTNLDLDFVYGSIKQDPQVPAFGTFIPLDGQQRLTTLFLLYWYIGTKELPDIEHKILMELLQKFTYNTRISSRKFCKNLTTNKMPLLECPKKEIVNQPWFFESYYKDPTIQSMLIMLDAIHNKYCEEKKDSQPLYPGLQNLQFYLLPLNGFSLTEDLYIKMNARGKMLTNFENFKADLTKWMKEESDKNNHGFDKIISLNGRKIKYNLAFSLKIDVDWTDIFWAISKNFDGKLKIKNKIEYPEGKAVDPLFSRFFYRYLYNQYVLSPGTSVANDNDPIIATLSEKFSYNKFDNFRHVLEKENTIQNIEKVLDRLKLNYDEIISGTSINWKENVDLFGKNITQPMRVIFFAVTSYLEKFDYDEDSFKRWMRVVWNIVENTDINDITTMVAALKVISTFSEKANCIYDALAKEKFSVKSSQTAVKEEIQKATFICQNPAWEKVFIEAESHLFFRGSVTFLISQKMTIAEFNHRLKMALTVFDDKGINKRYQKNGHLFLRALISQLTLFDQINDKNFTDVEEPEHYLKKMLASNENIIKSTVKWFSLQTEEEFVNELENAVKETSKMTSSTPGANSSEAEIRKVHSVLYTDGNLQNWMQENKAFRVKEERQKQDKHIYVSKFSAQLYWIMLDTCRNEIITYLLGKGCICDTQCSITNNIDANLQTPIPYFKGHDKIIVTGSFFNIEIVFTFDNKKTLTISEKYLDETLNEILSYDYVQEGENIITLLEKDILNENALLELCKKNK